jgi:hypothetical protein
MRSEGYSQESTSSGDNDAATISIRWHPAALQKTEIKADTSPNRSQALIDSDSVTDTGFSSLTDCADHRT